MTGPLILLGKAGVALCWLWPLLALRLVLAARRLPSIDDAAPIADTDAPPVSVVVPACNEADTIAKAARSLLALDYPKLEVVFVDDRSTDDTRRILSEFVASDPRARLVTVDALPNGWLGKVHALERGLEAATGEWILFTDADVEPEPDVLARALGHARAHDLGFVTLIPTLETDGALLSGLVAAYGTFVLVAMGPVGPAGLMSRWQLGGVGAFNLFERRWLAGEGVARLGMEVLDDVGLSVVLRDRGARRALLSGSDRVHLAWYRSVPEMMRGLSKNLFPAFGQFRYSQGTALALLFFLLGLGPLAALAHPSLPLALASLAAMATALAACGHAMSRCHTHAFQSVLLAPLGLALLSVVLVRSMLITLSTGGLTWRGTTYPIADLRKGQVVKIGA